VVKYLAAARNLEHKFHNSKRGEVGPIDAKLLDFGARDGPKHKLLSVLFSALSVSSQKAAIATAMPSQVRPLPAS
jgi:hypothetical protein